MRYSLLWLVSIFIVTLFSCKNPVKDQNTQLPRNNSKIRNGIVINSTGLNVRQAFLLTDDGGLVPENNIMKINQKIWLKLVISGWKERDSTVFVSGSEKVENSDGYTILDNKDLFKDFEKGLSPADAGHLSLSVVINQLTELTDYFKVSFKLKDELDPRHTVEGYYKLYLY